MKNVKIPYQKKKLINKVKIDMQILLNKYKETDNTEFLKTAVETYCILHPEMQNLIKLKHHISEVDKPENNNVLNILHQFEVEEAKKYMTLAIPQVENFTHFTNINKKFNDVSLIILLLCNNSFFSFS